MWTGTDDDNVPALRTYLSAGAALAPTVTVEWRF
jgi:hypothetical protein